MNAGVAREGDARIEPLRKKSQGIVHTPPLLARAMALRVDRALKRRLGRLGGLADPAVSVVDPACGPGAFLAACEAVASGSTVRPSGYLGIDLDADAIATAEALLREPMEAAGFRLELRVEDTLGERPRRGVAARARTAVVIGNPPWASKSQNRGHVISEGMLADFRKEPDGAPLKERKIGVLSDEYVRFLRWGAEVVRQSPGGGVLAMVTNSSWLDGPVHRGMRACFLRWFSTIDVYDLGGSALVAREPGVRDENVFGVRPGVAVVVATRPARHGELVEGAQVRYVRLYGSAEDKLARLADPSLEPTPVARTGPGFAFRATGPRVALGDALALDAIFPFHREGVQTNRDDVAIAPDAATLRERLEGFVKKSRKAELAPMNKGSGHYDPVIARERVRDALEADPDGRARVSMRPIAYRPYDTRALVPIAPLCHRPRPELLAAMDRSAFALVTVAKDRGDRAWTHLFACRAVPDNCLLSNRSSCRSRAFPTHDPEGRPNLSAEAEARFSERVGAKVPVEALLHYCAGVLGARSFVATHDAALRTALPVIPLPPDATAFEGLRLAGAELVEAFLAPPGRSAATIGHYHVECASDALAPALEAAEQAYLQAFPRDV